MEPVRSLISGMLYAGKLHLLIGPAASGKTTLARRLMGLVPDAVLYISDAPRLMDLDMVAERVPLIIIDDLLARFDEASLAETREVGERLRALADRTGAAILATCSESKSGGPRGASYLLSLVDVVFKIGDGGLFTMANRLERIKAPQLM